MAAKKRRGPAPTGKGALIGVRVQPPGLAEVDSWIAKQPEPRPSRPEALRKLAELGLAADRQRISDDRRGRLAEGKIDAERARLEYQKAHIAEDEKTDRLRQVRLAREEHDRRVAAGEPRPKRAAGAQRAKELAVDAVREALFKVDAPTGEKSERGKRLVKRPPGLERK